MVDGGVVLDLVHPNCGCDDCIIGVIPVRILSLRMNSRSRAAETSPRCNDRPVCSCV